MIKYIVRISVHLRNWARYNYGLYTLPLLARRKSSQMRIAEISVIYHDLHTFTSYEIYDSKYSM